MINCQRIVFSPKLSQRRMEQSESVLGADVLNRLLCFALYNLGVNRTDLSNILKAPPGTIKSTIRAINRGGLTAFEDRRRKKSSTTNISPPLQQTQKVFVTCNEESTIINIAGSEISIPKSNPVSNSRFSETSLK